MIELFRTVKGSKLGFLMGRDGYWQEIYTNR